jgi:hypothetical protein
MFHKIMNKLSKQVYFAFIILFLMILSFLPLRQRAGEGRRIGERRFLGLGDTTGNGR